MNTRQPGRAVFDWPVRRGTGVVAQRCSSAAGRLSDGVLTVTASEHRAQLQNRAPPASDGRLLATRPRPPDTQPTKPTRGSKERRIADKKRRADQAAARRLGPTSRQHRRQRQRGVDGQRAEHDGQVVVRLQEQPQRLHGLAALDARVQLVSHRQEPRACQQRHRGVQPAGGQRQRQRGQHRQPGVDQDLLGDLSLGGHGGQHRHARRLVVVLVAHRQRPGVRRRPEEDDREHHQGGPLDGAGDRGPADHHRHAAGGAAPHHVLRGAALQQQGVDEHVERDRDDGQQRPTAGWWSTTARRRTRRTAAARRPAHAWSARSPAPAAVGAVRFITLSMSASATQFRVLAPAAASSPPTRVLRMSSGSTVPRCASSIAGMVGDEQQLDHARLGQCQIRQQRGTSVRPGASRKRRRSRMLTQLTS